MGILGTMENLLRYIPHFSFHLISIFVTTMFSFKIRRPMEERMIFFSFATKVFLLSAQNPASYNRRAFSCHSQLEQDDSGMNVVIVRTFWACG